MAKKDDEDSSLRMIILVSSRRRENNIYGRLRGVLLPHLPLKLLWIVTKMYHIFIFNNYHSKLILRLAKKSHSSGNTNMNEGYVANQF